MDITKTFTIRITDEPRPGGIRTKRVIVMDQTNPMRPRVHETAESIEPSEQAVVSNLNEVFAGQLGALIWAWMHDLTPGAGIADVDDDLAGVPLGEAACNLGEACESCQ
jgi:hypothetical protein